MPVHIRRNDEGGCPQTDAFQRRIVLGSVLDELMFVGSDVFEQCWLCGTFRDGFVTVEPYKRVDGPFGGIVWELCTPACMLVGRTPLLYLVGLFSIRGVRLTHNSDEDLPISVTVKKQAGRRCLGYAEQRHGQGQGCRERSDGGGGRPCQLSKGESATLACMQVVVRQVGERSK